MQLSFSKLQQEVVTLPVCCITSNTSPTLPLSWITSLLKSKMAAIKAGWIQIGVLAARTVNGKAPNTFSRTRPPIFRSSPLFWWFTYHLVLPKDESYLSPKIVRLMQESLDRNSLFLFYAGSEERWSKVSLHMLLFIIWMCFLVFKLSYFQAESHAIKWSTNAKK